VHRFTGKGGFLYATGSELAFRDAPLDDCGDGFTWKAADPTLLCWVALHAVEAYEHGVWAPLVPERVRLDVAEVDLPRCVSGLHVRAHGVALPTTLLAEGKAWTLEQRVILSRSLNGHAITTGEAVALMDGFALDEPLETAMAVLPSEPSGAFVGFGETVPTTHGVKIIFDNRGVTHAHG
jgi:hypothetical protein